MSALGTIIFKIILLVVALMSGILAIGREALSIFAPNIAPKRSLFWSCLIIAAILSFSILWFLEHQKAISNEPRLNADFNIYTSAPAGEKNEDSIITIFATIINTGSPSIVKNIKFEIKIEGNIINGEFLPWPEGGLTLTAPGKRNPIIIKSGENILRKCLSQPIITGGAASGFCFLFFSGLKRDNISGKETTIILTFNDVLGKKYYFENPMNKNTGWPRDIDNLQIKE